MAKKEDYTLDLTGTKNSSSNSSSTSSSSGAYSTSSSTGTLSSSSSDSSSSFYASTKIITLSSIRSIFQLKADIDEDEQETEEGIAKVDKFEKMISNMIEGLTSQLEFMPSTIDEVLEEFYKDCLSKGDDTASLDFHIIFQTNNLDLISKSILNALATDKFNIVNKILATDCLANSAYKLGEEAFFSKYKLNSSISLGSAQDRIFNILIEHHIITQEALAKLKSTISGEVSTEILPQELLDESLISGEVHTGEAVTD